MIEVKRLTPSEFPFWNDYVDQHNNGTIFHKTHWLELLNPEVEVYVGLDKGEILGGVSLIKTKKFGISGYHIPPYTQYFSPLYGKPDLTKYSLTKEHEFIHSLLASLPRAGHYDFKFHYGHHSLLPYYWSGFSSEVVVTHILLQSGDDPIRNMSSDKQRRLKKLLDLRREGRIEIIDNPDYDEVWELIKATSKRKSFHQVKMAYSSLFNRNNKSLLCLGLNYPPHGLVSAVVCAFDNKSFYNLINTSLDNDFKDIRPVNLLLLYEVIRRCQQKGLVFDFEGSILPGVEFFFRELGGVQKGVYRVQKSSSYFYSALRAVNQFKNDRKKT